MSNLINMADNDGNTPLINAVRDRKVDIVEVLLRAGADVRHCNNAGESAVSLAGGHSQIWAMVGGHFLVACILDPVATPVSPPAASREPSPEPSFSPPPQPSASPESSPESSPGASSEASPEASPEASSPEASPEPSPDSDDSSFLFLKKFAWKKVARSTDSPEGSPEPSPKRQRQAPPASP